MRKWRDLVSFVAASIEGGLLNKKIRQSLFTKCSNKARTRKTLTLPVGQVLFGQLRLQAWRLCVTEFYSFKPPGLLWIYPSWWKKSFLATPALSQMFRGLWPKKLNIWTLPAGFDPPRAKTKVVFLLYHDCLDLCLLKTHDRYTTNCKIDCSFENFKCVCASKCVCGVPGTQTYALSFDNTRWHLAVWRIQKAWICWNLCIWIIVSLTTYLWI